MVFFFPSPVLPPFFFSIPSSDVPFVLGPPRILQVDGMILFLFLAVQSVGDRRRPLHKGPEGPSGTLPMARNASPRPLTEWGCGGGGCVMLGAMPPVPQIFTVLRRMDSSRRGVEKSRANVSSLSRPATATIMERPAPEPNRKLALMRRCGLPPNSQFIISFFSGPTGREANPRSRSIDPHVIFSFPPPPGDLRCSSQPRLDHQPTTL